jgi:hypothetical protein
MTVVGQGEVFLVFLVVVHGEAYGIIGFRYEEKI